MKIDQPPALPTVFANRFTIVCARSVVKYAPAGKFVPAVMRHGRTPLQARNV
jgi:hypothetical protein